MAKRPSDLKIEPKFGIITARRRCRLIQITVGQNESIDQALKRFNMKLQQSGLLREVKEHTYYEKPSVKRRRRQRRRLHRS